MADDYFLKIEGIEGESQDAQHTGEIALDAWSFGGAASGAFQPGGAGAGKFNAQDFQVTAKASQASPMLFHACATARPLPRATMTGRKAGDRTQDYLKVTLTGVVVSAYQQSGSGGSGVDPGDQVSLSYVKIELEYRRINPDGSLGSPVIVSFDVRKKTGPSRRSRRRDLRKEDGFQSISKSPWVWFTLGWQRKASTSIASLPRFSSARHGRGRLRRG